ncbi:MAG: hypothetical protein ATN32_04725 [Candidatus Epulonipiscium fishelsonii]|nr:MAG: hypothetical protein ATN32_04725 [Epulopiscium sp. AS2M-Bin002]
MKYVLLQKYNTTLLENQLAKSLNFICLNKGLLLKLNTETSEKEINIGINQFLGLINYKEEIND